jgi:cell division protein ZapA (FtsZ GTPase activity inhibitor)
MSELQLNPALAMRVEETRAAIAAAAREFDSSAADYLKEIANDTGTIPVSEYTGLLVASMLAAEVRRLRARVARLERGENAT